MRLRPFWRVTSFRLALWQILLFIGAFAIAGVMADLVVRRDELQAVDAEIGAEVADLKVVYGADGRAPLLAMIAARQRDPSIWEFRVEDAAGKLIAGDLPDAGPAGWSTRGVVEADTPDHEVERVRALRSSLRGGLTLTVGEDLGERERSDNGVLKLVLAVAAAAVALSIVIGAALARRALGQVEAMTSAMRRYGAGEHQVRARVGSRSPSDLDDLATALDDMLDRNSRLMTGLRQVSADIAHDLRRPLARHNERISHVLAGPPSVGSYRQALETARDEVDEVLRTFQALLHIAELEAGAPGLVTEPVDLGEIAARVVAAFQPMAEGAGYSLELAPVPPRPAVLLATPHLLTQLAANLVENALVHPPPGSHVVVAVEESRLSVVDDGPGIPVEARTWIFGRFTRLDASRHTPGTGLGLALASAIARAFGGRLYVEDTGTGLRVVADFSGSKSLVRSP